MQVGGSETVPATSPAVRMRQAWERARPEALAAARHWPILPILALAAVLRLVRLDASFFHGDEAEYVLVASYLAADPLDLAYPRIEGFASRPFVSQPPLVLYLFAFGIDAIGPDGALAVSITLGLATIAATYALGTVLRDRWLGGIAALFLAVLPYHVGLSRSAQLDVGLTFFAVLAALACVLYLRRPTIARAAVLGTAVACACLAKLPGVLVLAAVAVVLGVHARAQVRPRIAPVPRDRLRVHLGVALAPVTLAATLYVGLLSLLGATADLTAKLGWQAGRVAGADPGTASRPWHWYFTVPEVGLLGQLGLVLAALAVLGLFVLVRDLSRERQRRPERLLLLVWPALVFGFFMASGVKEWFYLMPAMPALCLLAAWPLPRVAARLAAFAASGKPAPRRTAVAWLAAFILLATVMPVHATVTERIVGQGRFGDGVPEAAAYIGQTDPGAGQVGTTLARFTLHLYNGGDTYHYYVNHTFVEQRIRDGDVRYVVIDTDLPIRHERQWLEHLIEGHNGTLVHSIPTRGGEPVQVYRLQPSP